MVHNFVLGCFFISPIFKALELVSAINMNLDATVTEFRCHSDIGGATRMQALCAACGARADTSPIVAAS